MTEPSRCKLALPAYWHHCAGCVPKSIFFNSTKCCPWASTLQQLCYDRYAPWEAFLGTSRKAIVVADWIPSKDENQTPFKAASIRENKKKSAGAKSVLKEGWGSVGTWFLDRNSLTISGLRQGTSSS